MNTQPHSTWALGALTSLLLLLTSTAGAQAPLLSGLGGPRSFGDSCLHRNDDGSSSRIDLTPAFPSGLRFFDETHTSVYVNTNGNITFSGPLGTFTPSAFPVANRPMIAPYWADIDTRRAVGSTSCSSTPSGTCTADSANGNAIWWFLEPGRMVVTWDETGYFGCNNDLRMHFQLILTAVPSCGGGATDFDVEFRFNRCEWETGDASGGTNGFGGTEAQSGFDAGNNTDFVMLPGSRAPGIANTLCTDSNLPTADPGVWRFQIRSGRVICPDAGAACTTSAPGVCGEGVIQCVGSGTECQPVVPASDEVCDALDNDCDGMVDEGEGICGAGLAICDRGVCTDVCFEGSCPDGLECNEDRRCVETGCSDVDCPAGQRCSGGECVDACAGIVCPAGRDCVAGRCLDLCEGLECDPECSVCSVGECVPRCDSVADCATGESCAAGLCQPTECVGVTCPEGSVCRPGGSGCVDACDGAVCPTGEVCQLGECVTDEPPLRETDMGPTEDVDAGFSGETGGGDMGDDGATPPGIGPRRDDDGCGCATPGRSREGGLPLALSALFGLALWRRRR